MRASGGPGSFAGNEFYPSTFVNIDHEVMTERNQFSGEMVAVVEHVPGPRIGVVPRVRFVIMPQIYSALLRREIRRPYSFVCSVVRSWLRR